MTRPKYSLPELAGDWERLRNDQKFQVLREDVAALREAVDSLLSNMGMDAPDRRIGFYRGHQSIPSHWQLAETVTEIQHDFQDVLRRLSKVEKSR